MALERVGQFVEFRGDDGIRYLARISSVQLVSDVDEMAAETYLVVAGRTILVREPLDHFREVLQESDLTSYRRRGNPS